MSQTIDDRIQSIDDQLKQLKKELEEAFNQYKAQGEIRIGGPGMYTCIHQEKEKPQ